MLAIATAALIVLATTAEAATSKYDYGGRDSYKMNDYLHYEPSFESHYAEQHYSRLAENDYREPHHDSYDEEHYGGDAYSEEPSYIESWKFRPTYKQTYDYRHKRSVEVREGQQCDYFDGKNRCFVCNSRRGCKQNKKYKPPKTGEDIAAIQGNIIRNEGRGGQMLELSEPYSVEVDRDGLEREGQSRCKCTNVGPRGRHTACSVGSKFDGGGFFCYVKSTCKDSKISRVNDNLEYSTGACCGFLSPCPGSEVGS